MSTVEHYSIIQLCLVATSHGYVFFAQFGLLYISSTFITSQPYWCFAHMQDRILYNQHTDTSDKYIKSVLTIQAFSDDNMSYRRKLSVHSGKDCCLHIIGNYIPIYTESYPRGP